MHPLKSQMMIGLLVVVVNVLTINAAKLTTVRMNILNYINTLLIPNLAALSL